MKPFWQKCWGYRAARWREAFRALEQVGLVQQEKNCGVFVRQITLAEADDIYEVRSALDELIGRKLASTITPTQVSALRALLDQMDNLAATGDVDGYLQTNLQFHDLLLNMTNNHKLINTYRRLVNELNLYRRSALAQTGSLPTSTANITRLSMPSLPATRNKPASSCASMPWPAVTVCTARWMQPQQAQT